MREIQLQIPALEAEQNVEIEVKVNGRKKRIHYRVEIIDWDAEEGTTEDQVSLLRRVIRRHDPNWSLVQIGAPSHHRIPIMFKKKASS
jgi:hypothetical protein